MCHIFLPDLPNTGSCDDACDCRAEFIISLTIHDAKYPVKDNLLKTKIPSPKLLFCDTIRGSMRLSYRFWLWKIKSDRNNAKTVSKYLFWLNETEKDFFFRTKVNQSSTVNQRRDIIATLQVNLFLNTNIILVVHELSHNSCLSFVKLWKTKVKHILIIILPVFATTILPKHDAGEANVCLNHSAHIYQLIMSSWQQSFTTQWWKMHNTRHVCPENDK